MEKTKQNSATIMISVYGKGAVFPVNLKLQANRLNKDIKKENFLKNQQINTNSDHSVSSHNSSKPLEC